MSPYKHNWPHINNRPLSKLLDDSSLLVCQWWNEEEKKNEIQKRPMKKYSIFLRRTMGIQLEAIDYILLENDFNRQLLNNTPLYILFG